ncbi:acyl-CoA thioesterase [Streptantibioticus rubrisoli]|jgi:4-hydroxybenzoyl-CoA thioesterase|nr:thioesterase family protein [Streptantibioticus rubrisoli]
MGTERTGQAGFRQDKQIWFHHCDPAGIVFYPQYLLLMNEVLQDWFQTALGVDYAGLFAERRIGIPTIRLECDFLAPSRLGDTVAFTLTVQRIGTSSFELRFECTGQEPQDVRVRIRAVLVTMSLDDHRSVPIPEDIRKAMEQYCAPSQESREASNVKEEEAK